MKAISILKYILLAVGVLTVVPIYIAGESAVAAGLLWMYVILALSIALIIIMPTLNMIQNPKGTIGSLIGLGILAVAGVIAYAFSSAEPVITPVDTFDNVLSLRLSDIGLYLTYATLAVAIVVAVVGEIINAFK